MWTWDGETCLRRHAAVDCFPFPPPNAHEAENGRYALDTQNAPWLCCDLTAHSLLIQISMLWLEDGSATLRQEGLVQLAQSWLHTRRGNEGCLSLAEAGGVRRNLAGVDYLDHSGHTQQTAGICVPMVSGGCDRWEEGAAKIPVVPLLHLNEFGDGFLPYALFVASRTQCLAG